MNLRELNRTISISILLFTVAIEQLQHCRIAADCSHGGKWNGNSSW